MSSPHLPSSLITHNSSFNLPRLLLVVLMLAYFIFCGLYASQRHLAFETGVFDTGVYTQPLWNFIQGRGFAVSTIEDNGPLRWATHVEPILFLIVPIYALWPDPRTLYWLQAGALTLAAVPMYALARRRLQSEWIALAIVFAYFLLPATQSVTLFDFHAVTFAPLFLLSAIYFLDRALATQGVSFWLWPTIPPAEKAASTRITHNSVLLYSLAALFFILALSTKEDISLHVFMIGVYLLILRRRWQEGGVLIAVGLIWFYVTFQMIIPAYRTAGGHSIYAAWFETLGNTPLEIALSPLTAPDKVLALIFRPGNIPALLMITLPLALLPWAGLTLFGLAAPSLAFALLSQNPTLRQLETWHYAAPMLAFIMLGTIDGLARLTHYGNRLRLRLRSRTTQTNSINSTNFPFIALTILLLTVSLTYHYYRGYTPLSQLFVWPEVTEHHELGREIAATIPSEASVLAQAQLIPHVAHRETLGIWSGPLITDYDYIWLDLSHPKLPNRFDAHGDLLIGLIYEHGFGAVTFNDGYLLLEKDAERVTIDDELFTFTEFDQLPDEAQPFKATFGDEIQLSGVKIEIPRLATSETEPQVVLYFDTLQQPDEDYFLFIYGIDEQGDIFGATDYPQPAIFWWPTSRWQTGDRRQVRVNTKPWWTGDVDTWWRKDARNTFGYAIGFSRVNDPWDTSARLTVTIDPDQNPTDSRPIYGDKLLPIAAFQRLAGLPYPRPLTTLPLIDNQPQVAK